MAGARPGACSPGWHWALPDPCRWPFWSLQRGQVPRPARRVTLSPPTCSACARPGSPSGQRRTGTASSRQPTRPNSSVSSPPAVMLPQGTPNRRARFLVPPWHYGVPVLSPSSTTSRRRSSRRGGSMTWPRAPRRRCWPLSSTLACLRTWSVLPAGWPPSSLTGNAVGNCSCSLCTAQGPRLKPSMPMPRPAAAS